jgi:hypothetical protein
MDDFWAGQAIGFVLGVLAGLLAPVVSRAIASWRHRVHGRFEGRGTTFSPESIKFFTLNRWSPFRPLTESDVDTVFVEPGWQQNWCDQEELEAIRRELPDPGGPTSTLRSLMIDHRESKSSRRLVLGFAPSTYADLLATGEYFARHPDRVDAVLNRFKTEQTSDGIKGAPASATSINVTVTTADRRILAIRRSGAVQTSQNLWTLGPNETMTGADPSPNGVETPHNLARRCLKEETGLVVLPTDRLEISWIGFNVPGALVHIVAHFHTHLRSSQCQELMLASHGAYEFDDFVWLPAKPKVAKRIIAAVLEGKPDRNGREWLSSAALAADDWARWPSSPQA